MGPTKLWTGPSQSPTSNTERPVRCHHILDRISNLYQVMIAERCTPGARVKSKRVNQGSLRRRGPSQTCLLIHAMYILFLHCGEVRPPRGIRLINNRPGTTSCKLYPQTSRILAGFQGRINSNFDNTSPFSVLISFTQNSRIPLLHEQALEQALEQANAHNLNVGHQTSFRSFGVTSSAL